MAKRLVPINVDFYQVAMGMNSHLKFEDLMKSIHESPDDDSRTHQIASDYIRIQECEEKQEFWFGNAIKIRMDEFLLKAKFNGEKQPVDFEDNEGIGYEAAFAYHKKIGILILQRNRNVLSADTLAIYLEKHARCLPIEFRVMLRADPMARLDAQQYYKTMEIKISRPSSGLFLKGLGTTPEHIESIMEDFESPALEIKLSVGRKKKTRGLSSKVVRDVVDKLMNRREAVEQLTVNGIELIDGVLSYTEKINADSSEGLHCQARWGVISRAWNQCAQEVLSMNPDRK